MKRVISIKLNNKRVRQRVETHTYYTGEARKNSAVPPLTAARIQASDDDATQLTDHLAVACSEIARLLSTYIAICHTQQRKALDESGDIITFFTLEIPANFPMEITDELEQAIENYAVARVLQQWMAQHKPDEMVIAANEVQQHTATLREFISLRKRPTLHTHQQRKIIDI